MTIRKYLTTALLAASLLGIASCAGLTPAEQDLIVKISARRLGAHGAQLFPTTFDKLGQSAKDACEKPGETLTPAQALEVIAQAITNELEDSLLARDLTDLIALLGVRFDPALKLIGLTEDQERLIKVAVCAFADGVILYKKPKPTTQT